MEMNYGAVKKRIQHFLLQQDPGYRDSVQQNKAAPSISKIASSLSGRCQLGARRLQKYLSEVDNEKELSINLRDLVAFAEMVGMPPGHFLSYVLEEEGLQIELAPWKRNLIDFFSNIHHSLRRELSCTVFSGNDIQGKEKLLDILLKLDKVGIADLEVVDRIVTAIIHHNSDN